MNKGKKLFSGVVVAAVAIVVSLATPVPTHGSPLLGTVQPKGDVWTTSDGVAWTQFSRLRPLVSGDHIRTDTGAYVLANLGSAGTVGMFPGSEVVVNGTSDVPFVGFKSGRMAFHVSAGSPLLIEAGGAVLSSSSVGADGYIETMDNGGGVRLIVERGVLSSTKNDHLRRNVVEGEVLELRPRYVKLEGAEAEAAMGGAASAAVVGGSVVSGTTVTSQGMRAIAMVAGTLGALVSVGGDRPASPAMPFE